MSPDRSAVIDAEAEESVMKSRVKRLAALVEAIYNRCLEAMFMMAGILVILMMLIISADVCLRFFFNMPVSWAFEMTEYALLYITFLAAAFVLKNDGHVRIDIVLHWLERRASRTFKAINIWTSLLMIVVCLLLIRYGFQASIDHYQRGVLSVKYYALPKAIFLIIIPIGSLFLLIECLKQLVKSTGLLLFRKFPQPKNSSENSTEQ